MRKKMLILWFFCWKIFFFSFKFSIFPHNILRCSVISVLIHIILIGLLFFFLNFFPIRKTKNHTIVLHREFGLTERLPVNRDKPVNWYALLNLGLSQPIGKMELLGVFIKTIFVLWFFLIFWFEKQWFEPN